MIRAVACPLLLAFIGLLVALPQTARGQVLDQLRHDVREGAAETPSSAQPSQPARSGRDGSNSNNSPSDPNAQDEGESESLLLVGAGLVAAAPFWGPHVALDDDFLTPSYFLRYSYWHDEPGSMFTLPPYGARLRAWQTELAFEYADNLDDLDRYGAHFRLSTTSRIDVETNWNTLEEETSSGRDHVTVGDVDLLYRFAQSEKLQFRSGLGANWFDDHQGAVAGFNFRYGADYFPCRPWHFAALFDLGELGKAGLVHVRSTAGITYARWELFTGYDYRKIGSVHFGGPVAGVQFRF